MTVEHPLADDYRQQVVAAVHDELARWGIDRFDVGAMAHRHGLDVDAIHRRWPEPEQLILDALAQWPADGVTPPDTGSLRADLYELAVRMAAIVTSETGRKLHGGHLIGDAYMPSVDVRQSAWRTRAASLAVVFERARVRGEIRDDIDYSTALELLFAPINMRALYTGEPLDDAYCQTVAELVCRAVSSA
jgi:Tetracyclin repressor-like, C-terminal domain